MPDRITECIQLALDKYNERKWPLQHYDDYVDAELQLRKELIKVYHKNNVDNAFWSTIGDGVFTNVNPETHRSSILKLYFVPNQGKSSITYALKNEVRITLRIECFFKDKKSRSGYIMDYTHISQIGE